MMIPMLFNTEMVQAIMEGRKTQTRRLVKPQPETLPAHLLEAGMNIIHKGKLCKLHEPYGYAARTRGELIVKPVKPPCRPGDILWVRETWAEMPYGYVYRADDEKPYGWDAEDRWKPSIHMPKEAARIFLRVKDVRVERLRDITDADAHSEGVPEIGDYPIKPVYCPRCKGEGLVGGHSGHGYVEVDCPDCRTDVQRFSHLWDTTIKPADIDKYGWNANPWVWVIEFERCAKPEGWCV